MIYNYLEISYDSVILFLDIYPRFMITQICAKTCARMFRAPFWFQSKIFKIAPNWKQPKCSLVNELVNKMWESIHRIHLIIQRKELLLTATKWKTHKEMMLSKRGWSQRSTHRVILFLWSSRIKQQWFYDDVRSVVTWGLCRGGETDGRRAQGDVLGDGYMTVCIHLSILSNCILKMGVLII